METLGKKCYASTKAALITQAKVLSKELGLKNIRVNAVAPGLTDTEMLKNSPETLINKMKENISLGRVAKPEEIANVILFLSSDLSSYITGQVIRVDGRNVMKNYSLEDVNLVKNFSKNLRSKILDMAFEAGSNSSHFGGALSIVEIVSTLFSYQMKIDKKDPEWEDRDRFILSKGHACLAYYAALSEIGYLSNEVLKTFEKDGSILSGHPVKNIKYGIEFSTGSLGIGLSIGIGLALAAKKKKNKKSLCDYRRWRNAMKDQFGKALAAPNLGLDNLFVVIDKNNLQQTGTTNEIMKNENLKEKWLSFGWNVKELDGHNVEDLLSFFSTEHKDRMPNLLIAKTIKGKGFSFSENNNDWHHAVMTKSLYEKAKKELLENNDN